MENDRYTVTVAGEEFVFTHEQLQSDPGNYFATYFLGDFAESKNKVKELVIEKEPLLFNLIQAHLRGYEILPLAASAVPSYMTQELALTNLLTEARFYALDILVAKIVKYQSETTEKQAVPGRRYGIQFQNSNSNRRTYQWHEPHGITEEQYKIFLDRYIHLPATHNPSHSEQAPAGYVVHGCWTEMDPHDGKAAQNRRLLVSDT